MPWQAVYRTNGADGAVWALTCENERHTLTVRQSDGVAPTFAPRLGLSPLIQTGGSDDVSCLSLAVDPTDRLLVGYGLSSPARWPTAELFAYRAGYQTVFATVGGGDGSHCPVVVGLRADFCPNAVAVNDTSAGTGWWLGVGSTACQADSTAWANGRTLTGCRQNGSTLCTH